MASTPARLWLAGLAALVGCGPAVDSQALDAVRGTWVTSDPRYAGRSFTFTDQDELVLWLGEGQATCAIEGLSARRSLGGAVEYLVTYVDDGGAEAEFPFLLEAGAIRLPGQPRMPWRRAEER